MNRLAIIMRHGRAGFTLLELLVVMAIVAAITTSIAPVYVASMDSMRTRNARNDLVAVIRYAQEVAVRESREHRVYFNQQDNTYRLMRLAGLDNDEKVFEPAGTLAEQEKALPENLRIDNIRARRERRSREYYVACLPNGASDNAVIRLRDHRFRDTRIEITVEGPLGKITLEESR